MGTKFYQVLKNKYSIFQRSAYLMFKYFVRKYKFGKPSTIPFSPVCGESGLRHHWSIFLDVGEFSKFPIDWNCFVKWKSGRNPPRNSSINFQFCEMIVILICTPIAWLNFERIHEILSGFAKTENKNAKHAIDRKYKYKLSH